MKSAQGCIDLCTFLFSSEFLVFGSFICFFLGLGKTVLGRFSLFIRVNDLLSLLVCLGEIRGLFSFLHWCSHFMTKLLLCRFKTFQNFLLFQIFLGLLVETLFWVLSIDSNLIFIIFWSIQQVMFFILCLLDCSHSFFEI